MATITASFALVFGPAPNLRYFYEFRNRKHRLLLVTRIFFRTFLAARRRGEERRGLRRAPGGKAAACRFVEASFRDRRLFVFVRKASAAETDIENTCILTAVLICHHLFVVNSLIREITEELSTVHDSARQNRENSRVPTPTGRSSLIAESASCVRNTATWKPAAWSVLIRAMKGAHLR